MFRGVAAEVDKVKLDTIIAGLLERLPEPGKIWSMGDRTLWLNLLRDSFVIIYRDDEPLPTK